MLSFPFLPVSADLADLRKVSVKLIGEKQTAEDGWTMLFEAFPAQAAILADRVIPFGEEEVGNIIIS